MTMGLGHSPKLRVSTCRISLLQPGFGEGNFEGRTGLEDLSYEVVR